MDALEPRAELFAALDAPEHGYWAELPQAKVHVRELQIFRSRQMTPVLFAAWKRLPDEDFVRLLKVMVVVSFRHTVVGSRNTNELEPAYHLAAKALLTGTASSPAQVFQMLRPIYGEDERFRSDFADWTLDTRGQRKQLAKYVLCKLESDASGRPVDFETEPATIEHVLPENPAESWDSVITPDRQLDLLYRVGNLSLLEPSLNRAVGNGLLRDKRGLYQQSRYRLSRDLDASAPEEWTVATIERRQQQLADRAVHVWRSDFA